MEPKILIDTNIAIAYLGNRLSARSMNRIDKILDGTYHISVINKIELLGYPDLEKNEEETFKLFINHSILYPIDDKIVDKTIEMRKQYKIKLPDAFIAATCLVYGLAILTINTKDFEKIEGLMVIAENEALRK
jgi:predicted nucleic acid-binding protein